MENYKAQMNTIRIIHLALMGGCIFFALVVAFLTITNEVDVESVLALNFMPPGLFVIVLFVYPVMFKATIKPVLSEEHTLQSKIATFQTGHIIRMALLEGVALFASVAALLNRELLLLIVVALTVAIMLKKLPTPFLLENELNLTREEKDKLG